MTGTNYKGNPLTCAFCGEEFMPKWVRSRSRPQRFCSMTCSNRGTGTERVGVTIARVQARDDAVVELTRAGRTPVEIGGELGVHSATVYRSLRRCGVDPVKKVRIPLRRDVCKRGHDLLAPAVPVRAYITGEGYLSRTCGVCVEERMEEYRRRPEIFEKHRIRQREYVARKREEIRRRTRKSDWRVSEQKAEVYAKAEAFDRLMAMAEKTA